MPEDYYGAASTPDATSAPPDDAAKTKPAETGEDNETDSALLPKSLFGESLPEVGDEVTFHVEHIWENEVEVSPAANGQHRQRRRQRRGPKGGDGSENGPMMEKAMGAFDRMNGAGSED
jgi:hypothetical protein